MLARTFSGAVNGIDARAVEIEVNLSQRGRAAGMDQAVSIVGLPDAAVKESRDRVFSAFMSSGLVPPRGFVVVNLAPAGIRKEGAAFDLGIALGIMAAGGSLAADKLAVAGVLGELALNGAVRPVCGVLPIAAELAATPGVEMLLVPEANAREAALAAGDKLPVYAISSLVEAVEVVTSGTGRKSQATLTRYLAESAAEQPDFSEVKGQHLARRALEIAAAGGHHVLMVGSPAPARPCSPCACRGYCRPSRRRRRSRRAASTACSGCSRTSARWSTSARSVRRTTRSRTPV